MVSAHRPPLTEIVVCQFGHSPPAACVVVVSPYWRPKAKHFLTTWVWILSEYLLLG